MDSKTRSSDPEIHPRARLPALVASPGSLFHPLVAMLLAALEGEEVFGDLWGMQSKKELEGELRSSKLRITRENPSKTCIWRCLLVAGCSDHLKVPTRSCRLPRLSLKAILLSLSTMARLCVSFSRGSPAWWPIPETGSAGRSPRGWRPQGRRGPRSVRDARNACSVRSGILLVMDRKRSILSTWIISNHKSLLCPTPSMKVMGCTHKPVWEDTMSSKCTYM